MDQALLDAIEKAKSGDRDSVEIIYSSTSRMVYLTALSIVGNPSDAEDITEDTYVIAIDKLNDLKNDEKFAQWLKAIATNLSKNFKTKKKPVLFKTQDEERSFLNSLPDSSQDYLPEHRYDRKEKKRIIGELVSLLPAKQRVVVELYYFDDMSVSAISELLETNENTIKSRLKYARSQIKRDLEALLTNPFDE